MSLFIHLGKQLYPTIYSLTDWHRQVRSAKNAHLAHFYIIVPALTISFVDAMLHAKDRLQKKVRACGCVCACVAFS